ncbi:MAG TPA: N-acetylmuramoyl-L-alanine amidase [Chitinophagaceae bacterium]|jgi:N-acetyl-anhydromuramyl-L-alanine amidase AmpD|nr:N-acetylmuramoyl-L-alanine amidase [Chitinophagaceae bacterium]
MNIQLLQPPLAFRKRDNSPVLVVLHATAGATASSSINHLRGAGLSYHYIITRDAKDSSKSENAKNTEPIIHQCVPNTGHAFHVGSTIPAPGGLGINKSSIGISLANIQRATNPERYPALQIAALNELLAHLKATIPSLQFLTTHAIVQPWNRADPRTINGEQLAATHGYEFWRPTAEEIKKHTPKKPK